MNKNKWFLNGGRESGRAFRLLCETYENKIATLEKENAELKETLETYNGCGDWDNDFHTCRVYLQHEELQMYIHQLTKAKEIIENLIGLLPDEVLCHDYYKRVYVDPAEQFLKEIK
jgi:hypothetical protein